MCCMCWMCYHTFNFPILTLTSDTNLARNATQTLTWTSRMSVGTKSGTRSILIWSKHWLTSFCTTLKNMVMFQSVQRALALAAAHNRMVWMEWSDWRMKSWNLFESTNFGGCLPSRCNIGICSTIGNSLGIVLFWSQLLQSVVNVWSSSLNWRPVVVVPCNYKIYGSISLNRWAFCACVTSAFLQKNSSLSNG